MKLFHTGVTNNQNFQEKGFYTYVCDSRCMVYDTRDFFFKMTTFLEIVATNLW